MLPLKRAIPYRVAPESAGQRQRSFDDAGHPHPLTRSVAQHRLRSRFRSLFLNHPGELSSRVFRAFRILTMDRPNQVLQCFIRRHIGFMEFAPRLERSPDHLRLRDPTPFRNSSDSAARFPIQAKSDRRIHGLFTSLGIVIHVVLHCKIASDCINPSFGVSLCLLQRREIVFIRRRRYRRSE